MYVISMSNFCFQEEVRLAREEASLSAERAHMAEVAAQSETGAFRKSLSPSLCLEIYGLRNWCRNWFWNLCFEICLNPETLCLSLFNVY